MNTGRWILALSLVVGSAGLSLAAPAQEGQSAKQDIKDAGHDTKDAAKDVGRGTKKAAKKTGHAVKKTTQESYSQNCPENQRRRGEG